MNERIKLVEGDDLPVIKLTLRNPDSSLIDVSNADVNIHFRESGASTTLTTIVCSKPNGGADGVATFTVPLKTLNIQSGYYEGEIEIDFAGTKQTVYEILQFQVRPQFS